MNAGALSVTEYGAREVKKCLAALPLLALALAPLQAVAGVDAAPGMAPTASNSTLPDARDNLLSPPSIDPTSTIGGRSAGASLTTGLGNTAFGYLTLNAQTTATYSTAFGYGALNVSTAHANNAFGAAAGGTITTGSDNIAFGNDALNNDQGIAFTTGTDNIAIGRHSLGHATLASNNVVVGNNAVTGPVGAGLELTGFGNTVVGHNAGKLFQTIAAGNVLLGLEAGHSMTTAIGDIIIGPNAGPALTTGGNNILIGNGIDLPSPTSLNVLDIGNVIYATNLLTSGSAPASTGRVGINVSNPLAGLDVLGGLNVAPVAAATLTTSQAQAVGGSTLLPFASTTGAVVGQTVLGTSVPPGDQVSSIVSTAQVTLTANGVSNSGQKVLTTTATAGAAVGQQCTDLTTPTAIGAGNVIASIQAGVSITLTSNLVANTANADQIQCDPVVTLTIATTAAVASGASITFNTNHTSLSTASAFYDTGDASVYGALNVGGAGSFLTNLATGGNFTLSAATNGAILGADGGGGAALVMKTGAGNYSTSAAAGDAVLRGNTGKNLILQTGGGGSAITINGTGVTIPSGATFTATPAITPTGGIAAAGGFTASPRNVGTCGIGANVAASAYTAQTPVTTEFYVAEVFVPSNVTVTGVAILNSATISGNVKVGLANSAGVNVATSGSVAMAGTSAYQRVPFSGTYAAVGPATYYVEVFYDNATVRPNTLTMASCGVSKATGQTYATGFTSITPPTTFTAALGPVANLY